VRIQQLHKGSEAAAHPDRCKGRKMDYAKTKLAVAIAVLACAVATAVPAAAQQVVLPPPILVTAQSVTISNSPGDQDIHGLTFTPISHQVSYQICLRYDPSVAKKSGSAYPIKLQLCDANGHSVSSASIVLQALGVTQTSNNSPVAFDDTGNANPDFDFRYDATFEGYIFNLSTKGYGTGMYSLSFTAGADPTVHTASFAVK
jgi:hypothetical protein